MPLVVLSVICLVVSGALAVMDRVTAPVISAAAAERAQEAMSKKIPEATGFEPVDVSDFEDVPSSIKEIYKTSNDVGHIFIAAVNGFSGDITVICGVAPDGTIIGTSALSHTETKGIGTIIEQDSFLSSFIGLDSSHYDVDTVTGATITTRAFIKAIEDVLKAWSAINNG